MLADAEKQKALFYQVFPDKVDAGRNPRTFDWMLSRTCDGTGCTAPRELIHLLNEAKNVELRGIETGSQEPGNGLLFDRAALRGALPAVSRARFEQTLLQEYPQFRIRLHKLKGRKSDQTAESLAQIWGVDRDEASEDADRLVEIGFFEAPTPKRNTYRIPFLYQPALGIIHGKEQLTA